MMGFTKKTECRKRDHRSPVGAGVEEIVNRLSPLKLGRPEPAEKGTPDLAQHTCGRPLLPLPGRYRATL